MKDLSPARLRKWFSGTVSDVFSAKGGPPICCLCRHAYPSISIPIVRTGFPGPFFDIEQNHGHHTNLLIYGLSANVTTAPVAT
jgi:hypothetical protein